MTKRIFSIIGLVALMVLLTGVLTAAAPVPVTTITLVGDGLPAVMNVGDTSVVVVQVDSDQQFIFAQALPSEYIPGRGVTAAKGAHVGSGTTATLSIPFYAKTSTADFGGPVLVSVSVGVRYSNGYIATKRFDFYVNVP